MSSAIAAGTFIIVGGILGVFGNGIVIGTCLREKMWETSPAYLLMGSIALPDLICCFIDLWLTGPSIILGKLAFDTTQFSMELVGSFYEHSFWTDFFHIPIISLSQLLLVSDSKFSRLITNRNISICIIFAWILPLSFSVPTSPLINNATRFDLDPISFSWHPDFGSPIAPMMNYYDYVLCGLGLALWGICDTIIVVKVSKLNQKIANTTIKDKRTAEIRNTTVQFLIVVGIYVVQCLLFFVIPNVTTNRDVLFLLPVANTLLFSSNFFIYVVFNQTFRSAFKRVWMNGNSADITIISSFSP